MPTKAEITVSGYALDPSRVEAPVRITHGRDDPQSQAPVPACTFTLADVRDLQLLSPGFEPIDAEVRVVWDGSPRFHGRVVNVSVGLGGRATVTCYGLHADWGRYRSGAPAWPQHTLWDRFVVAAALRPGWFGRIEALLPAGQPGASRWWGKTVAAEDIDRRTPLEALTDLAASTGCMLVQRRDGVLVLEPPDYRATAASGHEPVIIGEDVVVAAATWSDEAAQLINRVSATYGPKDTSNETIITSTVSGHGGERTLALSTKFVSVDDAASLGQQIVDRWAAPQWLLGEVTIDSAPADPAWWRTTILPLEVSALLSMPLTQSPGQLHPGTQAWFLEGWDEDLDHDRHLMRLRLSPARRYGYREITWADWEKVTWSRVESRTWTTAAEGTMN